MTFFTGKSPDSLIIVAGEHNTATGSDGVRHTVACKKEHPQYNFPNFDFAILTLDEPVDITSADSKARAACLPSDTSKLYENGELMTVSGWGRHYEGQDLNKIPSILHHVQVPGVSNAVCQADYRYERISIDIMCAGLDEGGIMKGACRGDSGGD